MLDFAKRDPTNSALLWTRFEENFVTPEKRTQLQVWNDTITKKTRGDIKRSFGHLARWQNIHRHVTWVNLKKANGKYTMTLFMYFINLFLIPYLCSRNHR